MEVKPTTHLKRYKSRCNNCKQDVESKEHQETKYDFTIIFRTLVHCTREFFHSMSHAYIVTVTERGRGRKRGSGQVERNG